MWDEDIVSGFHLIDEKISMTAAPGTLRVFRKRLLGEVTGDADLAGSTLDPDFQLIVRAAGVETILTADQIVANVRRQRDAGMAMWLDLHDLVSDADMVAAQGTLRTLTAGPDHPTLTTVPLAFFIRFGSDERMVSEVTFVDSAAAVTSEHPGRVIPSPEQLRLLAG